MERIQIIRGGDYFDSNENHEILHIGRQTCPNQILGLESGLESRLDSGLGFSQVLSQVLGKIPRSNLRPNLI